MNRRQAISLSGAALLTLAALILGPSCKKGPVDYGKFEQRTVEANLTTIDSAGTIYRALLRSGDVDGAVAQARAFLPTQAGVDSVCVTPDSSVWAFFSSGLLAGCGDDTAAASDLVESEPRPDVRVRSGGEVGEFTHIVVPHTGELEYSRYAMEDIMEIFKRRLGWQNFDTLTDDRVTLGVALGVINPGTSVLYWNGHGCLTPAGLDGETVPGISLGGLYFWKSAAEKAVGEWGNYLKPAPGQPRQLVIRSVAKLLYRIAILPAFIRANADFDQEESQPYGNQIKTVVCLSTCWGGYDYMFPNSFVRAFRDAGADVVTGYDWAVTSWWASHTDTVFLRAMADSCFPNEAKNSILTLTDPEPQRGRSATFCMAADEMVLMRAALNAKVGDSVLRSTTPAGFGKSEEAAWMTSYMHSEYNTSPHPPDLGNLLVQAPAQQGTFDCTTQNNARISWLDVASARYYWVQKDYVGVSGTITLEQCRSDAIIGRFSGTLGWWDAAQGHYPTQDPPDTTISIENGMMRVTGRIPQGDFAPQRSARGQASEGR